MKRLLPFLLCLGALALRLWGIRWGLPNADHTFSYHTDETVVLLSSLQVHPLLLLLDPGHYAYGCLVPIANGLVLDLGTWTHLITPSPDSASALLACRLVTAVLGATTCGVLIATGKRLWGEASGFVAGALYAVAPLAVQHAHFATVDVHATFWISLCLLQTSKILTGESKRALLWAGAFAGLSAAAKYNAGVVLLAPLAASLIKISLAPDNSERKSGSPLLGLGAILAAALAGFVAGCPAVFLNPGLLFEGLANEAAISRTDHGGIFAGLPPAFVTQVLQGVWTMGPILPFVVAVALVFAVIRRKPSDLALLVFVVPYFVMIGASKAMYARYTLPLFPPLFLLVGALATTEKRKSIHRSAIAVAGITALGLSVIFDVSMTGIETRDVALAWLRKQNFQKIGFATGPWHYHPPLVPALTNPRPDKAKEAAVESGFLLPADGEWNITQLNTDNPSAVVLSEPEFMYHRGSARDNYLKALLSDNIKRPDRYRIIGKPLRFVGDGGSFFPFSLGCPYDMSYPNPSIVVFFRR